MVAGAFVGDIDKENGSEAEKITTKHKYWVNHREYLMLKILVVAAKTTDLTDFEAFLLNSVGTEVYRSVSGEEALKVMSNTTINAVVVGELPNCNESLSFVRQVTKIWPLVNCAMVSSLAHEDFHEATEGLGIFMQLPVAAGAKDAELMLQMLETIEILMTL